MQTVFLALLRSLGRLRDDERLGPWLVVVAKRQAWRVRNHRRRPLPPALLVPEDAAPDPAATRAEEHDWLQGALERLPERCRSLLTALYLSGPERPYAEIAAALGIPQGSIGPTRARCLERLRQELSSGLDPA